MAVITRLVLSWKRTVDPFEGRLLQIVVTAVIWVGDKGTYKQYWDPVVVTCISQVISARAYVGGAAAKKLMESDPIISKHASILCVCFGIVFSLLFSS